VSVGERRVNTTLFLETFVLGQLVGAVMDRLVVSGSGLSPVEFAVTSTIGAMKQVTPTELAQRLGVPPTTLSALLNRLEERDLIFRTRHPADGRVRLLELTAGGRAANQVCGRGMKRALQLLAAALGDDSAQLFAAFNRFEDALRSLLDS
jgi:DNA-binding MarR family transcriptional regulator